jgi:hypothetical protein
VMSKEHSFMFPRVLVYFTLCMSSLEFCTLNALGSCIMSFSFFASCVAVLYLGLFFQLSIGS